MAAMSGPPVPRPSSSSAQASSGAACAEALSARDIPVTVLDRGGIAVWHDESV